MARVVERGLAVALWPTRLADYLCTARVRVDEPVYPPPVFLVGAPRTGTTLAYQVITNMLDVLYPSNLTAPFSHSMYVGLGLHKRIFGSRPHQCYQSDQGRTAGAIGPHQCPDFWYRWFPRSTSEDMDAIESFEGLRRTVSAVSRRWGRPFVTKNVNNSLRIRALSRTFPEALFIFCTRDPFDTAASILKAREKRFGDKSAWLGVTPKNGDSLKSLPYAEQIAGQVFHIERQIIEDLAYVPSTQWMVLKYEDMCEDAAGQLARVSTLFQANGYSPESRAGANLPKPYAAGSRGQLGADDLRGLQEALDQFSWPCLPQPA